MQFQAKKSNFLTIQKTVNLDSFKLFLFVYPKVPPRRKTQKNLGSKIDLVF